MLSSLATQPQPTTSQAPEPSVTPHAGSTAAALKPNLRSFLNHRLHRLIGRPKTLLLTVPIIARQPQKDSLPQKLLELAPDSPAFFWSSGNRDGDREERSGIGVVHGLRASGRQRFDQIRWQAESLTQRFESAVFPGCEAIEPRFFGGFAFDTDAANDAPWQAFGDAWFMLPRFLCRGGQHASLTLTVDGEDLTVAAAHRWTAETLHWLTQLADPPETSSVECGKSRLVLPSESRFTAAVEGIRRQISRAQVAKIVAAHQASLIFDQPLNAASVLSRLPKTHTTQFAFRHGETCFLGATPERLVSRQGSHVLSEALAGSASVGAVEARRLQNSVKETHEHRLVVQAIQRRLAPYCERLMVPTQPQIRRLRGLQHLATPIHGSLIAPSHVLELAQALHPTPAVAGVPATRARHWIKRHEADPRGWYAAPVGWFDTQGQGEFAVALRCCVINGHTASVFAGAGIVAGSDPRAEYRETILKMRPLLAALQAPSPDLNPSDSQ